MILLTHDSQLSGVSVKKSQAAFADVAFQIRRVSWNVQAVSAASRLSGQAKRCHTCGLTA